MKGHLCETVYFPAIYYHNMNMEFQINVEWRSRTVHYIHRLGIVLLYYFLGKKTAIKAN